MAGWYVVHHLFVRTPGPPLYQYLTFTQNFWMATTGKFGIALLAIRWSLAVEERFYALRVPLVRFNPSKRLLAIVIGCMLLAPVLRYFLIAKAGQHGMFAAHVLLFTHFDALMRCSPRVDVRTMSPSHVALCASAVPNGGPRRKAHHQC